MPARSKVAMLPAEVRTELDRRIVERAFSGYQDLAEWLQGQGYHIAHDSVQRHGSRLLRKIEAMERLAEDAKALTAAAAQAGDSIVDVTIQLIHQRVLSMLLDAPEPGEESSSSGIAAGAPHSDRGALQLRDLVRLTRIVADLSRVTIARQRQAEQMKSQLELEKRAAGNRSAESEGPVSEEAYHRIRIALFGDRRAPYPERREGPGSADVPACEPAWEHPSEISGAERNEASKTQLDADRLAWTPEGCSNASAIEAVSSDEGRLRGEAEAQVGSSRAAGDSSIAAGSPAVSGMMVTPGRSSPRIGAAPEGSSWRPGVEVTPAGLKRRALRCSPEDQ